MGKDGVEVSVPLNADITMNHVASEKDVKTAAADSSLSESEKDVIYWTGHSLNVFASLLKNSGAYTEEEQADHLRFFKERIIPNLGPRPSNPGHRYELMTHNGSPIEFSLNFSGAGDAPAVRFSYEPKGTADHISESVGAWMQWEEQIAEEFSPNEEDKKILCPAMPQLPQVPKQLLAVDFKKSGKRAMKAYLGPIVKQITTGIDPNKASIAAIRRLKPLGEGFAPALDALEAYRAAQENPDLITMLGIDCIEPEAGARIKMYTRVNSSAFDEIRDRVTLGGKRNDAITKEGVQILEDIWELLLNEPGVETSYNKPERNPPSMHSGLMISWEFALGRDIPEPKVYVPLWQFAESNQKITENLESVFKKWNWKWGTEGKYSAAMADTFKTAGIYDKDEIVHTYVTFNFSKKGIYLTTYMGTPIVYGACEN